MNKNKIMKILGEAEALADTRKYSNEIHSAIADAAGSDDPVLKGKACMAVAKGMHGLQVSLLRQYGITPSDQDFEDIEHAMFVKIMERLPSWNPAEGNISTFFMPEFKRVITQYRVDYTSSHTLWHEYVQRDVNLAKEYLSKMHSEHSPSLGRLFAVLNDEFGRKYSQDDLKAARKAMASGKLNTALTAELDMAKAYLAEEHCCVNPSPWHIREVLFDVFRKEYAITTIKNNCLFSVMKAQHVDAAGEDAGDRHDANSWDNISVAGYSHDPYEEAEKSDMRTHVRRTIGSLDQDSRRLLSVLLSEFRNGNEGIGLVELAEKCGFKGISVREIKKRRDRAYAEFRRKYSTGHVAPQSGIFSYVLEELLEPVDEEIETWGMLMEAN